MLTKEIFEYKGTEVPEGCFKISPSQISNFFNLPKIWYQDNILKQEKAFQGNTSSVLGTALHYIYEQAFHGNAVSKSELNNALDEYAESKPDLGLNTDEIKLLYPQIATAVLNDFITPLKQKTSNYQVETEVWKKLDTGIYVAGKTDLLYGTTVTDFKNVTTKPSTIESQTIPFDYKIQLLAYAYMHTQQGKVIDTIELVYGVRPTKTLPARCFTVRNIISKDDWKLIGDTLQLITESVKIVKEKPELIHLIFKSMDLKQEA